MIQLKQNAEKGNILNISTKVYEYKLRDNKNRLFPVYYDGINTHVLNHENITLDEVKLLKKYASIRLDFYDENAETVKRLVNEFLN